MEKMEEDEFYKQTKNISDSDKNTCTHPNIVKLYYMGANSDYGCLTCGACGTKEYLRQLGEKNRR